MLDYSDLGLDIDKGDKSVSILWGEVVEPGNKKNK